MGTFDTELDFHFDLKQRSLIPRKITKPLPTNMTTCVECPGYEVFYYRRDLESSTDISNYDTSNENMLTSQDISNNENNNDDIRVNPHYLRSSENGVLSTYSELSNNQNARIMKEAKTKKFKTRYLSHNSSHSDDLEVVLIFESDYIGDVEDCMKVALRSKQYRKRKEIYHTDVDTLKSVLKKCDKLITSVNRPKVKTQKRAKGDKNEEPEYNYYMYVDKLEDETNNIIEI